MENTNQITVSDLSQIKVMIEVACERGAFRAPELKTVGTIYERLTSFLNVVMVDANSQSPNNTETNTQGESQ